MKITNTSTIQTVKTEAESPNPAAAQVKKSKKFKTRAVTLSKSTQITQKKKICPSG